MCWSLFLLQIENLLGSLPIVDPEIAVKWSLVTPLFLSLLCQPAPFCSLYLLGLKFNLRSFNTLICLSLLCCFSHFSLFLGRGGDQNSWLPVRINVNSWDLPPIKKPPTYTFLFFLSLSPHFFLFLAQIPAKWCQNNIPMYLMTYLIFVKDDRKDSEWDWEKRARECSAGVWGLLCICSFRTLVDGSECQNSVTCCRHCSPAVKRCCFFPGEEQEGQFGHSSKTKTLGTSGKQSTLVMSALVLLVWKLSWITV